jgi:hypothetical protein
VYRNFHPQSESRKIPADARHTTSGRTSCAIAEVRSAQPARSANPVRISPRTAAMRRRATVNESRRPDKRHSDGRIRAAWMPFFPELRFIDIEKRLRLEYGDLVDRTPGDLVSLHV